MITVSTIILILLAAAALTMGVCQSPPVQPPHVDHAIWIDLEILRRIESGGDPSAVSHAGARGPYQITRAAWRDGVASIARRDRDAAEAITDYDQWVHDETMSHVIAWEYVSRVLPAYLVAGKLYQGDPTGPLPDCVDTRLAAWNAGALTVRRAYAKSPANWQAHLPGETREFLRRYHRIRESQKSKIKMQK